MPKLAFVEKRIFEIEGFQVEFLDKDDKNVRSDKLLPKQYEAEKMSKNSFTVSEYKEKLTKQFPGYKFNILRSDGKKASGQTNLSTVRDTYLADE